MAQRVYRIREGDVLALTITTPNVSTSGKTVYAYAVDSSGTATLLGSASGEASGTSIVMTLNFGNVSAGRYVLEVVADPSGAPVTLVPNDALPDQTILDIYNMRSIAA